MSSRAELVEILREVTEALAADEPAREVVMVRAEVVERMPGVGILVELFSKTDQYRAWVREDSVYSAGSAAEPTPGGVEIL